MAIVLYGYIRPNIPELKVWEKQRYDAWYCGLCRSIGKRYSLASRILLSYDSAFLAMLLSDACGNTAACEKHICPVRPLCAKKPMVALGDPALDYAADVCVILAEFKLKDDVQDGKKLRRAAKLPLLRTFSKARRNAPKLHAAVSEGIARLNAIEEAREISLDLAANAFGDIMRAVLENAPLDNVSDMYAARKILSELGYWLGRAIYFLDAWDDRADDAKHGLYNPFLLTGADQSDAEFEIAFSINSAVSAYNLLDRGTSVSPDRGIEDNVFGQGLFAMWDRVRNGETHKKQKDLKKNKQMKNDTDVIDERTDKGV